MSRARRSKQLPYLTEYIRYAVSWRHRRWNLDLSPATIGLGAAISLILGLFAVALDRTLHPWVIFFPAGAMSFALYTAGAYGFSLKHRNREPDPEIQLRREAKQVADRLEQCLDAKRLHRDLSIEVSALLEEASRNWNRARAALGSPYWRRADLPAHLRAVREQSLLAIDQGMQEMLVLFATSIPDKPSSWSFSELVDEVLGQDVFASRGRLDHISPFFDEARGVAGKLKELADQVESVSRQLAGQELITGAPRPGAALDVTLSELRQLKQAEEELHQDLRL